MRHVPCWPWWAGVPVWISNYIHYDVWDRITYPLSNFNGAAVEVWGCISNFIPHFIIHVITYPCWDQSYSMLVKGAPRVQLMQWIEVYLDRGLDNHYDVHHTRISDETNFRRNISFRFYPLIFWIQTPSTIFFVMTQVVEHCDPNQSSQHVNICRQDFVQVY